MVSRCGLLHRLLRGALEAAAVVENAATDDARWRNVALFISKGMKVDGTRPVDRSAGLGRNVRAGGVQRTPSPERFINSTKFCNCIPHQPRLTWRDFNVAIFFYPARTEPSVNSNGDSDKIFQQIESAEL
jgi:hypothetical protein